MENTRTVDPVLFHELSSQWLTGVTMMPSVGKDDTAGLTMNAVASLPLPPPQFLVNLDLNTDTLRAVDESYVCINLLASPQGSLCSKFATESAQKFECLGYRSGIAGTPVFEETIAHAECAVERTLESGDNAIVIGNVVAGEAQGGEPLVCFTSVFKALSPCS
jgi:flavin reductase (DIM6/NTAB) family NADH-FMN oxidoreductase RutF